MIEVFSKSNKKLYQGNLKFILVCAAYCLAYFVRDVIGLRFDYFFIYAFAAFIIFFVSKEEAVCFLVGISAFTQAGYDGKFSMLLLLCMLIKFAQHLGKIQKYSLFIIFMCAQESILYFSVGTKGIGSLITYVFILMVLFFIQQYPSERIDKIKMTNTFIAFSAFFIISILIKLVVAYGSFSDLIQLGFRSDEYSQILKAEGLSANANYITLLSALNICLCTLLVSKGYSKKLYIPLIAFFTFCGLLTISKMFFAVLFVYILFVVFMQLRANLKSGVIAVVGLVAVLIAVYVAFGDTLISMVIERFMQGNLTTGRTTIVKNLISYMNSHPFSYVTGVGILEVHTILDYAIHSSVFEILGGWGIIGLVLVVMYVSFAVNNARLICKKQCIKINAYNYLPLGLLLGYTLIGMLFSSAFSVIQLQLCLYAIQIREKN